MALTEEQKKEAIENARAEGGDDFAAVIEQLMEPDLRDRVLQVMGMDVEVLPGGSIKVRNIEKSPKKQRRKQ